MAKFFDTQETNPENTKRETARGVLRTLGSVGWTCITFVAQPEEWCAIGGCLLWLEVHCQAQQSFIPFICTDGPEMGVLVEAAVLICMLGRSAMGNNGIQYYPF